MSTFSAGTYSLPSSPSTCAAAAKRPARLYHQFYRAVLARGGDRGEIVGSRRSPLSSLKGKTKEKGHKKQARRLTVEIQRACTAVCPFRHKHVVVPVGCPRLPPVSAQAPAGLNQPHSSALSLRVMYSVLCMGAALASGQPQGPKPAPNAGSLCKTNITTASVRTNPSMPLPPKPPDVVGFVDALHVVLAFTLYICSSLPGRI